MRDKVDVEKVLGEYRPTAPRPALRVRIASTAKERTVVGSHTRRLEL
jgi:hypothetical protein